MCPGREDDQETQKRAYDNSRREARARETREKIIEGVVSACLDSDLDDLSVAAVAERTEVSAATIYRYFPNREVLLEAVDRRIGEKLGRPELPETIDEMAECASELTAFFEKHLELMKLARITADKLDKEAQGLRDRLVTRLMEEDTAHLSEEDARGVQSIFRSLFSLDLYLLQRDRFGLSPGSAGQATQWAIETLLAALRREREQSIEFTNKGEGP